MVKTHFGKECFFIEKRERRGKSCLKIIFIRPECFKKRKRFQREIFVNLQGKKWRLENVLKDIYRKQKKPRIVLKELKSSGKI